MGDLRIKLSFLSLSILLAHSSSIYAESNSTAFPLHPRVLGEGFFGNRALGEADAMLPILGNQDGIFYVDGLGKVGSDDGYLGSLGAGFRGVYNNYLWGAYVFGDYNRAARGHHFPVVNPGLELMTNYWDAHVNGYFPTSKRKSEGTFLGTQLGTTQYISFRGHSQFDNLINVVEEVGNGVDGEIGLTLPEVRYLRLFTGGYHFNLQNARDINGVVGGVEMPINNNLSASVRDSYDRVQKNTALFTVRLTLGGINKGEPPNVSERILDPIPRHLGTWDTGSGIPSEQAYINTGVRVLTRDNIWFFSNAGTPFIAANGFSNCTFENNCINTSFTQSTVNAIDGISPNANFYLGNGTYFTGAPTSFLPASISMHEGQAVFGRSADFVQAQQQIIRGQLVLEGKNTFDSIAVTNDDGQFPVGLVISGSDVSINNAFIGFDTNDYGFRSAVNVEGANNVSISNSVLMGFVDNRDNVNVSATGVAVINSNNITLRNNTILVDATQRTANSVAAQGIFVDRGSNVSIENRQLDVQAHNLGGGTGVTTSAQGIVISQNNSTFINKSMLSPIASDVVTALQALHGLLRISTPVAFQPSSSAAFNIKAEHVGGTNNAILARGFNLNMSNPVKINYNNDVLLNNALSPQDHINVSAENTGGTGNKVTAQGALLDNSLAIIQGPFLNVTALDNQGINGKVTAIGYQAQGTSVFSSVLNLSGSFNVIQANSINSNAELDAKGIRLEPVTSKTVIDGDNANRFRVTVNGTPVYPAIDIG